MNCRTRYIRFISRHGYLQNLQSTAGGTVKDVHGAFGELAKPVLMATPTGKGWNPHTEEHTLA